MGSPFEYGLLDRGLDEYYRKQREKQATPGTPENLIELSKKAALVITREDLESFLEEPVFESADLALDAVSGNVEVGSDLRSSTIGFTGTNSGGVVRTGGQRNTPGNLLGYKYELEIWPSNRVRGWYERRDPLDSEGTRHGTYPFVDTEAPNSDPRVAGLLMATSLAELGAAVAEKQRLIWLGGTILECTPQPRDPAFMPAFEMAGLATNS